MKISSMMGLMALGFMASGCATIVNGTSQSIAITSSPASGAQCTLVNSEGTYYVTTPGNVTVHKTKNDLNATCKKQGFEDVSAVIPAKFQYATAGNILAGGVIGVAVDAASGANFEYPASTNIDLKPLASSTNASFQGAGM